MRTSTCSRRSPLVLRQRAAIRSISCARHVVLGLRRPGFDAGRGDQMHGVGVAAHDAGRRRHVVGENPVAAFSWRAWPWHWRSRRRSRRQSRSPAAAGRLCDARCVDRMSGFSTSSSVGVRPCCFLILLSLGLSARQSATAAANTATSAGSAVSTASSICRAVSTLTTVTPGGSGMLTGPLTRTTSAPARGRGRGDRVALFARGSVGDEAHRIDRLVGRTRGHQHALARERSGVAQQRLGGGGDLQRLGHAADAGLAALGHLAARSGRPTRTPSAASCARLRLRRLGRPHVRVHRRREQHRLVGREQHRGGEIVGMAARHLRHQIGGGRRDHDQIGVARQPDMADVEFALRIEQIRIGALAAQGAGGERRDEMAARPRSGRSAPARRDPATAGSGRAIYRRRCRRR